MSTWSDAHKKLDDLFQQITTSRDTAISQAGQDAADAYAKNKSNYNEALKNSQDAANAASVTSIPQQIAMGGGFAAHQHNQAVGQAFNETAVNLKSQKNSSDTEIMDIKNKNYDAINSAYDSNVQNISTARDELYRYSSEGYSITANPDGTYSFSIAITEVTPEPIVTPTQPSSQQLQSLFNPFKTLPDKIDIKKGTVTYFEPGVGFQTAPISRTEVTPSQAQAAQEELNPSLALVRKTEAEISKLPIGLRQVTEFGYGVGRQAYTGLKGLVSLIPGSEPVVKRIDIGFAIGTAGQTTLPYSKEYYKSLAENINIAYTKGPQEYSPYISKNPYILGGGAATEAAFAYIGAKGIGGAAGYINKVAPSSASIVSGATKAYGLYSAKQIAEGGYEAYKQGDITKYVAYNAPSFLATLPGFSKGVKEGEVSGFRQRLLANVTTPTEKASLLDKYKGLEMSSRLSSAKRSVLDLSKVEIFKNNPEQISRLTEAMKSPEMKPYVKKIVVGGSASQSMYGLESSPHDIDIYVKQGINRPKLRSFVSDEMSGGIGKPAKITWERPSYIENVKGVLEKYKVKTSEFDIHELPTKGSSFSVVASGFSERPIKTAKGSLFEYQTRMSEQAGRKFAQTIGPEHLGRGKDWPSAINIATERFGDTEYVARMKKWQPEIKPSETSKESLSGPSYYQTHPAEAPKVEFTWFEKQIRKYGKPVTTEELYVKGTEWKPEAQAYRPQFIEKPTTPPWAKGVTFWSAIYPFGTPSGAKGYTFPLMVTLPKYVTPTKKGQYIVSPTKKVIPPYPISKGKTPTPPTAYVSPSPPSKIPISYTTIKTTYPTPTKKISYPTTTPRYPSPMLTPRYPTPIIITKPSPYPTTMYTPKKEPKKKETLISGGRKVKEKERLENQGYIPEVRADATKKSKARWVSVSKQPLPYTQALGIAGKVTDETVSRRFRVREVKQRAIPNPRYQTLWQREQYKFRPIIKKGQRMGNPPWIEKTAYAIDTHGEFSGITVEGWKAIQRKKQFKPLTIYKAPSQYPMIKKKSKSSTMGWKPVKWR